MKCARVMLAVVFEEFEVVDIFFFLFSFHNHCQLVPGGLSKKSEGMRLQPLQLSQLLWDWKSLDCFLSMFWSGQQRVRWWLADIQISFGYKKEKLAIEKSSDCLVCKRHWARFRYTIASTLSGYNSIITIKVVWSHVLCQLRCCEADTPLLVLATTAKLSDTVYLISSLARYFQTQFHC